MTKKTLESLVGGGFTTIQIVGVLPINVMTTDVVISSVDLTKAAIVHSSFSGDSTNPDTLIATAELLNSTTIRFFRRDAGNTTLNYSVSIMESN